ncbi:hypothetical protein C8R42DRAFT_643059 [Lentinula raphanica]|nr:hypothetical protein C8R42DRAFT_643059 [Lentinula raphanica]
MVTVDSHDFLTGNFEDHSFHHERKIEGLKPSRFIKPEIEKCLGAGLHSQIDYLEWHAIQLSSALAVLAKERAQEKIRAQDDLANALERLGWRLFEFRRLYWHPVLQKTSTVPLQFPFLATPKNLTLASDVFKRARPGVYDPRQNTPSQKMACWAGAIHALRHRGIDATVEAAKASDHQRP